MFKKWSKISPGDNACIVAPAYGVANKEDVQKAVDDATWIVQLYNLTAFFYPNMITPNNHSVFDASALRIANSDEARAKQLIKALKDPECDLVWAFKGGYGSIRLIKYLASIEEPSIVKPLIGFSDITILHSFLNNIWQWPSVHFGMPGSLPDVMKKDLSKESFSKVIFSGESSFQYKLEPIVENKEIELGPGILIGGNMFCFEKMLGTKFSPSLKGKVLLLEDVGEPARKIDGFLQKLSLFSDFEQMSAVIFGEFSLDGGQEILFNRIVEDFALNNLVPVFRLSPENTVGHGNTNVAIMLGASAEISYSDGFKLNVFVGEDSEQGIKSYL